MGRDSESEIRHLLAGHVGGDPIKTLGRGQPNWITKVDRDHVWVETERSRSRGTGSQPIPLEWLVDAYYTLEATGVITRRDLTVTSSKRSAFVSATLARLPGVSWQENPIELRFT